MINVSELSISVKKYFNEHKIPSFKGEVESSDLPEIKFTPSNANEALSFLNHLSEKLNCEFYLNEKIVSGDDYATALDEAKVYEDKKLTASVEGLKNKIGETALFEVIGFYQNKSTVYKLECLAIWYDYFYDLENVPEDEEYDNYEELSEEEIEKFAQELSLVAKFQIAKNKGDRYAIACRHFKINLKEDDRSSGRNL